MKFVPVLLINYLILFMSLPRIIEFFFDTINVLECESVSSSAISLQFLRLTKVQKENNKHFLNSVKSCKSRK